MRRRLLTLVALSSLFSVSATAQGLAEAARKEKQRRDEVTASRRKPAKVYTEDTLTKKEGGETAAASPAPAPSAARSALDADGAQREAEKADWASRAEEKRQAIAQAQRKVEEVSARLERASVDLNPVANVMDPFRRQSLEADVAKLKTELETARRGLQSAKDELVAFEDEARRKNVPPGWIRDR